MKYRHLRVDFNYRKEGNIVHAVIKLDTFDEVESRLGSVCFLTDLMENAKCNFVNGYKWKLRYANWNIDNNAPNCWLK